MAKDLETWLQACRSRSGEEDISFEGLEEIKAHIDPTDFVAFNNYERNLRIFSNFCLNTDTEYNPWVVVNTGDRYAARKSLMQTFRSHLHEFSAFESYGKSCSPCSKSQKLPPGHTRGIEINEMMKAKFSRSRRHHLFAWLTFMCLLLLAFIYAENTNWDDSWFRTPKKYNVTALLEGTDEDIPIGPGKPSIAGDDVATIKEGKTSKNKKEEVDYGNKGNVADLIVDDGPQKTAKTTKVSKEKTDDDEQMYDDYT